MIVLKKIIKEREQKIVKLEKLIKELDTDLFNQYQELDHFKSKLDNGQTRLD